MSTKATKNLVRVAERRDILSSVSVDAKLNAMRVCRSKALGRDTVADKRYLSDTNVPLR